MMEQYRKDDLRIHAMMIADVEKLKSAVKKGIASTRVEDIIGGIQNYGTGKIIARQYGFDTTRYDKIAKKLIDEGRIIISAVV